MKKCRNCGGSEFQFAGFWVKYGSVWWVSFVKWECVSCGKIQFVKLCVE
jgi:hypothetical protein